MPSVPPVAVEKFYFGVSNSAFQVEGQPADSDWRRWTLSGFADLEPHIVDGSDADLATDFWRRYDEDFALAQNTGMNAFRISIAWDRIEPLPGVWDDAALDHYVAMIVAMRQRGLEPFVTLQHFVLPAWLADAGGVLCDQYPEHFARYAEHVAAALSAAPANVRFFMTLNEPNIQARSGYLDERRFPPGLQDPDKTVQAFAALAEAHIKAYERIHAGCAAPVQVGYSHSWHVYEPFDAGDVASCTMSAALNDAFNRNFVHAVLTGNLDFALPHGARHRRTVPLTRGPTLDFLGIQNYGRSYVRATALAPGFVFELGDGARSDMGWEIVPDALYRSIKEASVYGIPLMVTETGLADQRDILRPQYLRDNFHGIERALSEGISLFGYFHWSLTDNFEWGSGLTPRFGLVEIDYANQQKRIPRPSLGVYRELIRTFQQSQHP